MKYSIITINYNNNDGLQKTIDSVINQSYKDYEYIIIDGGSTDGSLNVIKNHADKLAYWVSEPDNGIFNAMNKGIRQSHGDYLIFMNSGDCFYNYDVLKSISKENFNEDIVTGKFINSDTPNIIRGMKDSDITFVNLYDEFLCHQATFFKSELFKDKLYDESFKLVADWKFYTDVIIMQNGSFRMLNHIIAYFDSTGVSQQKKDAVSAELQKAMETLFPPRVLKDYQKYKFVQSPILDLIPEISNSVGFAKLIYKLLLVLVKTRNTIYCLKSNFTSLIRSINLTKA